MIDSRSRGSDVQPQGFHRRAVAQRVLERAAQQQGERVDIDHRGERPRIAGQSEPLGRQPGVTEILEDELDHLAQGQGLHRPWCAALGAGELEHAPDESAKAQESRLDPRPPPLVGLRVLGALAERLREGQNLVLAMFRGRRCTAMGDEVG